MHSQFKYQKDPILTDTFVISTYLISGDSIYYEFISALSASVFDAMVATMMINEAEIKREITAFIGNPKEAWPTLLDNFDNIYDCKFV